MGSGPLTADPAALMRRAIRQLTAWSEFEMVDALRAVARKNLPKGAEV